MNMAITSSSQILDLNTVSSALSNLDVAVGHLNSIVAELNDAKFYVNEENLLIRNENTFDQKIELQKEQANTSIATIKTLKESIYNTAVDIRNRQQAEYDTYVKKQKEKKEAVEKAAAELASNYGYYYGAGGSY